MKKKLAFLGGCLISLLLLIVIFINMDWSLFLAEIKKINLFFVIFYVVLFYLCFLIRSLRWKYLLPKSEAEVSLRDLLDANFLGFFASNILPLRAGEFIRPLVISKWTGGKFATYFASVVSERVFDVLALLLLLGISLQYVEARHDLIYLGAKALGAIALAILFAMILSYFFEKKMLRLFDRILSVLLREESQLRVKLISFAKDFISGLKSISSTKDLLIISAYSLLLWTLVAVIYQVFLWAFGVYPSFNVGMTVSLMIAFAVAVPSAPGFIGTFQFGCIVALSVLYPYSKEFAAAYSIICHGVQYLTLNLVGVYVLKKRRLHLKELRVDDEPQIA